LYAVRVDTSLGFELCPADVCQVGDAFCPVGEDANAEAAYRRGRAALRIIEDFRHPIVERYRKFIADHGIGIAGIEFITDRAGEIYTTYDVNTNTKLQRRCRGSRRNLRHARHRRVPGRRIATATHRRGVGRAGRRLSQPQRRPAGPVSPSR
jgi:hypothetical protein